MKLELSDPDLKLVKEAITLYKTEARSQGILPLVRNIEMFEQYLESVEKKEKL